MMSMRETTREEWGKEKNSNSNRWDSIYSDSQNCSNVSHFWKKSLITPSGKSVNIWKYLGG